MRFWWLVTEHVLTQQHLLLAVEDDSVTMTSKGSELELRVQRLQESVLQRERDLRRREMEQRRRKKAILREQEELLQSQLKVTY